MNKVFLIGRLTVDPDMRYTTSGKAVTQFSIAVNEGYGEKQRTTFVRIIAWGKLAEICGNNLLKGQQILVEGHLNNRSYDDKDGKKVYITEVIMTHIKFLGGKPALDKSAQDNNAAGSLGSEVIPDEEIPF